MRRLRLCQIIVGTALALVGAACGPSAFELRKAAIDQRVAALQQGGKQDHGQPRAAVRITMGTGQWVQFLSTTNRGTPSFLTYKVVGVQPGAYWIELLREGYWGNTVQLMLVERGDGLNPETVRVRQMKIKDSEGRITEYSSDRLQSQQTLWKPILLGLVGSWERLSREDVTVPAGSFLACYKERVTVSAGMYKSSSEIWYHPDVPITGMVKKIDLDDFTTVELAGFGLRGASSELLDR